MDTTAEKPAQILVIDDNNGEVQELRGALTECGEPYELSVLRDGEAALRFVADHRSGLRQPEPCVIVLDLNLPKHDVGCPGGNKSRACAFAHQSFGGQRFGRARDAGAASGNGRALSREAAGFRRFARHGRATSVTLQQAAGPKDIHRQGPGSTKERPGQTRPGGESPDSS
jgi:hypothetical protein